MSFNEDSTQVELEVLELKIEIPWVMQVVESKYSHLKIFDRFIYEQIKPSTEIQTLANEDDTEDPKERKVLVEKEAQVRYTDEQVSIYFTKPYHKSIHLTRVGQYWRVEQFSDRKTYDLKDKINLEDTEYYPCLILQKGKRLCINTSFEMPLDSSGEKTAKLWSLDCLDFSLPSIIERCTADPYVFLRMAREGEASATMVRVDSVRGERYPEPSTPNGVDAPQDIEENAVIDGQDVLTVEQDNSQQDESHSSDNSWIYLVLPTDKLLEKTLNTKKEWWTTYRRAKGGFAELGEQLIGEWDKKPLKIAKGVI